jgi:demethylmenaquinone methyltransferase/2-methoxy-6-polyprenyl-1,4-benzoquinol methylase
MRENRAVTQIKDPNVISAMFDRVSPGYDRTNALISLGQLNLWRKRVVAALGPPKREWVLDFAAGTGASTLPLLAKGWHAVALDFSIGMLRQGQVDRAGVPFIAGDGAKLPFKDDVFSAVTCSFGLRNCQDTLGVLGELMRVTKPRGRLVICEFSRPTNAWWRGFYQSTMLKWLPKLADLNGAEENSYRYLVDSIGAWYDQPSLARLIAEAGWGKVTWRDLAGGAVAIHQASK